MAQRAAKPIRKAASSRPAGRAQSLKQLIARTNTIADKVAELLGELRRLEKQGFVIKFLASGKSKTPSA